MARRREPGDSGRDALRALKRRLSDVVYRALQADLVDEQDPRRSTEEQGTVELGVRITDAAVASETTVVCRELRTDGPVVAPGAGRSGSIATASSAGSPTCPSWGIHSSCGSASPGIAALSMAANDPPVK